MQKIEGDQFYLEYKEDAILQQLVGEIPWGHNILILSKVKDKDEREYYLKASAEMGWSRNVLLNQIKAGACQYQKSLPEQHNFSKVLPKHLVDLLFFNRYLKCFVGKLPDAKALKPLVCRVEVTS